MDRSGLTGSAFVMVDLALVAELKVVNARGGALWTVGTVGPLANMVGRMAAGVVGATFCAAGAAG